MSNNCYSYCKFINLNLLQIFKRMLKKGTKLYSIVKMKCPRCNKGCFFKGSPYKFSTMGEVKEKCENCHLKYSIEPGFFQGSYYVSYALGVALSVAVLLFKLLFLPSLTYIQTIILIVSVLIVLSPLLYALSKIIYINFFVSYNETFTNKNQ